MSNTEIEILSTDKSSKIILIIKDKLYSVHNYRLASVSLESQVFRAKLDRIVIDESEFSGFISDFIELEEIRQGKIALSAENPDQFALTLHSIDKLGHFAVSMHLGTGNNYSNNLDISFEIDPSSLPILLLHLQGCDDARRQENKIKTNEYKQHAKAINEFLEEWDFIGVISMQHKDEYTDLINPILQLLTDKANAETLADFISKEVTEKYGMAMKANDQDTLKFSKRVIDWWSSK